MVLEAFPPHKHPNLTIGYIKDQVSDAIWSANLDHLIQDHLGPNDTACLYGGRDSFIPHYKGCFETRELVSDRYISGTEIRQMVSQAPESSASFRAGAIWATFQRYPSVYPTVDVVVYDSKEQRVLLARKTGETGYRAVGGFVSPEDDSYEHAALRELREETGLTVGLDNLVYLGSRKVDDWRYRAEVDRIITHLYVGGYTMGAPKAADDIAETRWFAINKVNPEFDLVPEHRHLWQMFLNWRTTKTPLP